MSTVTTIRAETPADIDAIHEVVAAAFNSETEAELVAKIRASENFVAAWSLVATDAAGAVCGHVMVSHVEVVDGDARRRVTSLAPLAVAPAEQGKGIGSALVREVTARVESAGEPLIVLEGDPRYYSRFGFELAPKYGINIHLPSWAPPEAAQVMCLRNYDASIRGDVVYPPAFADVTDA